MVGLNTGGVGAGYDKGHPMVMCLKYLKRCI